MDQTIINNILEASANDGKIYSNEQDFQFDFAKALNDLDEVEYVKLEALSLSLDWRQIQDLANNRQKISRDRKEYTDILVKLKNGEYIAIELKFKTPDKLCCYENEQSGRILTMAQGAYDINAYSFITDIIRLENINNRHFYKDINISKGYAIMLSNYSHYRYNDHSGSSIWMNYGINHGRVLNGLLKFNNGATSYTTTNRTFDAVTIKGVYKLLWRDYPLENYNDYKDANRSVHPGFSYLVVEVNP
jgi:hypothetical protein